MFPSSLAPDFTEARAQLKDKEREGDRVRVWGKHYC
ncbi:hypothetical protein, unlikely [Trypanosoma brucei brucei TREU927]|uniref:Uncharacterized protein n=1 Tax=Trypanosoma brucei brucei (strain 927/4 GUTat10.1) TaxID=185431 RepID=Q4GYF2_TRYB2|nr:hypothetical protein, unlikely [Trypanosoma brucei brucei TREU927]CAJ16632.1 hypothetical protein, unlikely [Trypanosoma brucei brucei TREU927]